MVRSGHSKKQTGFTLLEVLVSGFILFLVLASMTELYRGALISSGKAEGSLLMSSAVPVLRANISELLRESPPGEVNEGDGKFGRVHYRWTAKLTHIGKPSKILQEDLGRTVEYSLWNIELSLRHKGSRRLYNFSEVTW